MKLATGSLLCVALYPTLIFAQQSIAKRHLGGTHPQRTVIGQTLVSRDSPPVKITIREPFRYIGGQRFTLYNADAEQHLFVDTDEPGRIRRMFWIQFEHYSPNNSETYRYKQTTTTRFGTLDFFRDVRPFGKADDPNTDTGHLKSLIENNGLHWPANAVRARFVHLPNPDKRSELMIIYVENSKYAQVPVEELTSFESDQHWPQIEKLLVEHAQRLIEVERK